MTRQRSGSTARRRGAGVILGAALLAILPAGCAKSPDTPPASLVVTNARIYTADSQRRFAEAVAVRNDQIVAVGNARDITALIDDDTRVIDAGGRLVLPGLHDSHIHLYGIVDPPGCDLASRVLSLPDMVAVLKDCLANEAPTAGEWLAAEAWNYTEGNWPTDEYPTLRAALDAVSTEHPILLRGNDGHNAAVNSRALARARGSDGTELGLSAATLAGEFAAFRDVVGVDANGVPNGRIAEHARALLAPETVWGFDVDVATITDDIAAKLAENGITSAQDTWMYPEQLRTWLAFADEGSMSFRLVAALFPRMHEYRQGLDGEVDIPRVMKALRALRASAEAVELVAADGVKIFIDGVIEGNPLADPPSLPNAAVLEPYHQPLFEFDESARTVDVVGYVDTASELCSSLDEIPTSAAEVEAFRTRHGFHPGQCRISRGVLEHPQTFVESYITALDAEGFTVHAHAIGDRAARLAVDAFEAARDSNGETALPHNIAHAQFVHPVDQRRAGALGLFVTLTFAWIETAPDYDVTVAPFVAGVHGNAMYARQSPYTANIYPARTMADAGVTLVAGSDAPVDTPDPRPFFNLQQAITRRGEAGVLGEHQQLDVFEAVAAYTIDGARALRQEARVGSIETGKLADMIMVDQDIFALARNGRAGDIEDTRVLLTVFNGEVVFELGDTGD